MGSVAVGVATRIVHGVGQAVARDVGVGRERDGRGVARRSSGRGHMEQLTEACLIRRRINRRIVRYPPAGDGVRPMLAEDRRGASRSGMLFVGSARISASVEAANAASMVAKALSSLR